jgi:hypothetical protein
MQLLLDMRKVVIGLLRIHGVEHGVKVDLLELNQEIHVDYYHMHIKINIELIMSSLISLINETNSCSCGYNLTWVNNNVLELGDTLRLMEETSQ